MEDQIQARSYGTHYRQISQNIVNKPKQDRKCTNCFCVVFFILFLGLFLAAGISQIIVYVEIEKQSEGTNQIIDDHPIFRYLLIIVIGVSWSIILSFIYIFIARLLPQQMMIIAATLCMITLASLITIGIIWDDIALYVIMGLFLVINAICIGCLYEKLKFGGTLVKISSQFIKQKPSIYALCFLKLIFISALTSFYIYTIIAISAIIQHKNNHRQNAYIEQLLLKAFQYSYLVFVFIFYYVMCFLVSSHCANWYYKTQGSEDSIVKPFKWAILQIGSLVLAGFAVWLAFFASITFQIRKAKKESRNSLPRFTMIRLDGGRGGRTSPDEEKICCIFSLFLLMIKCMIYIMVQVCFFCMDAIFHNVDQLTKVFNHYTVIMISLTGESFVPGAKSVLGLVEGEMDLLRSNNLICGFLMAWGLVLTVGVPSIIAFLLVEPLTLIGYDEKFTIIFVVAACSLLVSIILLQVVTESVSCSFILYLFDKDLMGRKLINIERMNNQTYLAINRFSHNPYEKPNPIPMSEDNYIKINE